MDLAMTGIILMLSCQHTQAEPLSHLTFPFTQTSIASRFSSPRSLLPERTISALHDSLLPLKYLFFLGDLIHTGSLLKQAKRFGDSCVKCLLLFYLILPRFVLPGRKTSVIHIDSNWQKYWIGVKLVLILVECLYQHTSILHKCLSNVRQLTRAALTAQTAATKAELTGRYKKELRIKTRWTPLCDCMKNSIVNRSWKHVEVQKFSKSGITSITLR